MHADEEHAYFTVIAYTLTLGDPTFLHQYVVDAWTAQHAGTDSKPIGIFFALVGLYLHAEHGFTGREVQRAHMKLARHPEAWPACVLPGTRGTITAREVAAAPEGPERDAMIRAWAHSVWEAHVGQRAVLEAFLRRRGIIGAP